MDDYTINKNDVVSIRRPNINMQNADGDDNIIQNNNKLTKHQPNYCTNTVMYRPIVNHHLSLMFTYVRLLFKMSRSLSGERPDPTC